MDLGTLSQFLQSSLAYECISCNLYFGTEIQLITHHKLSHSKRLKVSLNPELTLTEDDDYKTTLTSNATCVETENDKCDDKTNNTTREGLEPRITAELAEKTVSEPTINPCSIPTNHDLQVKVDVSPDETSSQSNPDSFCTQLNEEPVAKRIKTESDLNDYDENVVPNPSSNSLEVFDNNTLSIKETIEQGHYGYLTKVGFRPFSVEELKKFAVQIVALFKLDESQEATDPATIKSQPLPVIQNDVTTAFATDKPGNSGGEIRAPTANFMRKAPAEFCPEGTSGKPASEIMEDPNKSCYKCGEVGHFAWACTNARVPGLAPKRRRNRKRRHKSHALNTEGECL